MSDSIQALYKDWQRLRDDSQAEPEQFERCNSELLSALREVEWKSLDCEQLGQQPAEQSSQSKLLAEVKAALDEHSLLSNPLADDEAEVLLEADDGEDMAMLGGVPIGMPPGAAQG